MAPPAPPEVAAPWPLPAGLAAMRQIRLVARRQLRLLFADHIYFLFLAVLPFAVGGADPADPRRFRPGPAQTEQLQPP